MSAAAFVPDDVALRPEEPGDRAGVRAVLEQAFPTRAEADLVDALRAEGAVVPELCLVATARRPAASADAGDVVGHVAISRARLDDGAGSSVPVLALAPVAVLPEQQGRGIGGALVRAVLARAARTEIGLVILLGHPEYYPRFGFEPAGPLGVAAPFDVPPDAWMAYRLPAYAPGVRGTVVYADAFGAVS